jgi:exopolyphosphatase/guanosine-5'-triphosphate,3'-diphosphate pyrophosphatase
MVISSIDIGSNTILLLIAEYNGLERTLETIYNEYRIPRISKNLKTNLMISNEKVSEMWNVLYDYNAIIQRYKCNTTIVVATNALRIAKNGNEIVENIRNKFGWDIKIISGEDEARMSFIGSVPSIVSNTKYTVIDIGGGSSEIICGSKNKIDFKQSFEVGVVSLFEKFINTNPPSIKEINEIELELLNTFDSLNVDFCSSNELIAVAGTPTTLSCMKQGLKLFEEDLVNKSELTLENIIYFISKLSSMNSTKILNEYGDVVKGREDVLLTGCLILKTVMKILKKDKFIVSSRGLRYGVIIDYINSLYGENTDLKLL